MIDSKALKNLNKKLEKIAKKLQRATEKVKDSAVQELVSGANEIRNTIILGMQKDEKTGLQYRRGKNMHTASAKGEYPAVDRGPLLASIFYNIRESDLEVELGNLVGAAPYGGFLEEGTENMEPRPWLEPSVAEHKDSIVKSVGDVSFDIVRAPFKEEAD